MVEVVTGTTTSRRSKTKYPEWLTWLTDASDTTTTSFFENLKSSAPSQSPLTSVSTLEMTQSAPKGNKLKSKVNSCYMCGVLKMGIPRNQECYQVFDSPDLRYRYKKKRFRVKCVHNSVTYWSGRNFYGPFFRGGCFKRFLDIGTIYNERGCRVNSEWSKRGTYASNRFRKLEKLLNKIDDGCVSSPHASLTPFSRAISLYARNSEKKSVEP
ncbi:unnamed protein product [Pieris macdunnoughi]|uniref:Uncharacterized protein n=1 Tax=Pieris macdunnoughi TaxID=345717 RepID=A0A821M8U0_9NEOP|nr:unnamed protein product [Pieris macdunnoughi]